MKNLCINIARLKTDIEELGKFGKNAKGGLDRTTFTPSELEAREWLKERLHKLKLAIRIDQAANIWAKRPGQEATLPSISFGSHIDTVPNGGKYDGALGVLIALEVMRVLEESHISTRHPLELVSFSAEEPNPFGLSTFGSRAISGKLKKSDITNVTDSEGTRLVDALRSAGGDPENFEKAVRNPAELSAFLEVHIEQGKRLLNRSIPVGVVTAITGIYREKISVYGEANHAGTTLMEDRKDALTAASEIILSLERVSSAHPSNEVVGTIGKVDVSPNAPNIIPEKIEMILEIRGKSSSEIYEVLKKFDTDLIKIRESRPVQIKRKVILDQTPAPMNELVVKTIQDCAESLNYPSYSLGSMAGHDATHMASLTKSGMLFVPSLDGKSHCPEEESRLEDIEKVANVLLHTILSLDQKLDV
ncbi:Zn-dependent hydrolase [Domibacillus indicus]|uniref:Zn-dependent hydrolase n=1 Tax=Domibacillus indicus TaxID=1437523 RepID=UPI0020417C10|nr:Zn-dependent hydrolase [Domibacillus indicus]MCM3790026.1 Zn-dependent hydrolase [Domibacillus indicus]